MPELVTIVREQLPHHPLLGRNFRVDSRSLSFPFQPTSQILTDADHKRYVGPFDQGNVGSCTGNAAIGCMATGSYYDTVVNLVDGYSLDEQGAVACYSAATALDGFPGTYPDADTGSDGTAVAQALKNAGMISGYTHAMTGMAARLALGEGPIVAGVKWFKSMFTAGSTGRVTVDRESGLAGGHEIVFDAIDVDLGQVWFTQSWGPSWGVVRDGLPGRAYFTFEDFDALIADQGDATVFTLRTAAPPEPVPVPPSIASIADREMWQATAAFRADHHVMPHIVQAKKALTAWGAEMELA